MLESRIKTIMDSPIQLHQESEERYLITEITWLGYETLLKKLEDKPGYRVTYLDGVLEIVSPSLRHESIKKRIGDLLLIYFLETDTEYYPKGSTTFRKEEKKGGTEADESYCIGVDKEFPDIAIEVIITSGSINCLAVYNQLGVKEVWFWQNESFSIYHLREENPTKLIQTYGYELIQSSEILAFLDINLLTECVNHPNPLLAAKEFRQKIRNKL